VFSHPVSFRATSERFLLSLFKQSSGCLWNNVWNKLSVDVWRWVSSACG